MIDELLIEKIKTFLNIEFKDDKKRLKHIFSVEKMAISLAEIYSIDKFHVRVSALLHDATKRLSYKDNLNLASKSFSKQEINLVPKSCLHAYSAAQLATEKFQITNRNILNAISYHCSGRKAMSKLEQIIFISDYIEETRLFADDDLRKLAKLNLDKATYEILNKTIEYLKIKKRPISELSIEALEYYKKKLEEINER